MYLFILKFHFLEFRLILSRDAPYLQFVVHGLFDRKKKIFINFWQKNIHLLTPLN
jgi:hypothetical protein